MTAELKDIKQKNKEMIKTYRKKGIMQAVHVFNYIMGSITGGACDVQGNQK